MEHESQLLRWTKFSGLLVAVVVISAYANSFSGAFVMDDGLRIVRDSSLQNPVSACLHTTRPLVGLSLWLNVALGGRPADFHLFNLLVHLSAALLLFGIMRRVFERRQYPSDKASALAALGAAVWATHPLQTQSVTYIIQRAESMMGLLLLLTIFCFVCALASPKPRRWLVGAVIACALGMTAKPVMVVAPVVVLLLDRQITEKSFSQLMRCRRGFYAALFATVAIAVVLSLIPNESSSTTGGAAGLLSPVGYLLTECGVIMHYLKLIVWPVNQCLDYAWPAASGLRDVWWQAVVLSGLVVVAGVGTWRRWVPGFGLALFLIMLAPSSSVIPVVDAAVEHRLYLPLVGILICVGALLLEVVDRVSLRREAYLRVFMVLGLVLVSVLAVLTHFRNADYHSVLRMSRDTVAKRPDNFRARSALVMALLNEGLFADAERAAREMVSRAQLGMATGGLYAEVGGMNASGYYPVGLNELGRSLLALERIPEALDCFDQAAAVLPTFKEALFNKAIALHAMGNRAAALNAVAQAIAVDPEYEKAVQFQLRLLEVSDGD